MKEFVAIDENLHDSRVTTTTPNTQTVFYVNGDANSASYGLTTFPFKECAWERLKQFASENDSTFYTTMLSVFRALRHRYNIEEAFAAGNAIDPHSLSQTTTLTIQCTGNTTFLELFQSADQAPAQAINAGEISTEPRTLFVMFQTGELADSRYWAESPEFLKNFELAFIVDDSAKEGLVRFNANTYNSDTINSMIAHFMQLMLSGVSNPGQKIGSLAMITTEEAHELMEVFNNTQMPYHSEKTVVDLFEAQVLKTPHNTALFHNDDTINYESLNHKANKLAHYLLAQGVKRTDNVALLATRGIDMIVALFAILKTGAAYVPIEPDYPEERQRYILNQSSVKFLLSNVDHSLHEDATDIKAIDLRTASVAQYSNSNPAIRIDSESLAYTIYTSGSTGVPKGVMIEHHSVVNLVTWVNHTHHVNENDRLLFITSVCFDLSVYDIFGMLATGGAVVVAEKNDVLNTARLAELLQKFHITFWDSVPTTMDYLVSRLAANDAAFVQNDLRLVFLSGDWIPVTLPGRITQCFPNAKVISLGGATEGTVWSNAFPIDEVEPSWHSIPYGKPIANNAFYILNDQLQPVPDGVAGELYIGGVGVARGYANDMDKTRSSFLTDPFTAKWGGRMYKTGDLGRMLPDGNMEFLGRKDNQVKIRGHRVELGEIEHIIREYGTVSNVVVLFHKEKQQLASYIIPGKYYDRETVITHLKRKLPEYMIPARWMELEQLPLTANGKIDTKTLLSLDTPEALRSDFVAPSTALEIAIAGVWQRVLSVQNVSIHDNFFNLGGQSLVAVELITEIEKATGRHLPVNTLYKHSTIARLCDYLNNNTGGKKWESLVAIKSTGHKMPLYIVHGDGLSLSNFQSLAEHIDDSQPVFSLQPRGLSGADAPFDNIDDIAQHYVAEIMEHNPAGPYALAGYSFGGFVAVEMKKKLEALNKKVKMVAIFDTDAENVSYKKDLSKTLPRKIKRQIPKFLFIAKSMISRPQATAKYQYAVLSNKINNVFYKLGIKEKPAPTGINVNIDRINEMHAKAFRNFELTPFDDKIHLFKAKSRMYFVDDFDYLGWANYAREGVNVYDVPGDHKTMFLPPNVTEFARQLQYALDHC